MTGAELRPLLSAGVYVWRRQQEALYVGASARMLGRVAKHNVIGIADELRDSDIIEFWPIESEASALLEEARLHAVENPRFSARVSDWKRRACLACRKQFDPARPWQKFCSRRCRNSLPPR